MPHELTKEERMSLLKYEDERKRYSWASKPQIRKYDHIHNGRISVGVGLKRRFRDGKLITLEEQLGDLIIAIFIAMIIPIISIIFSKDLRVIFLFLSYT